MQLSAQEGNSLEDIFGQSYSLEKEGEYSKAINLVKTVYAEDSYEINIRLGWLTYLSGNFSDALPYYRKCIQLHPLSIEARLGLALPLSQMGNWTEVETLYKQILEMDPQNSLVNYRMGLLYYGREDYSTAQKYFESVVNHYPFDYDSVIMLAWTDFKLGKYREAKVLFNKALLMEPNDESAQQGLDLIK
jgi:tetratricopeptide (TPR) repeat protein